MPCDINIVRDASDHSAEYGSSNTCQLGTYKIIYKNKSKQFLLISDHPRARDNS